ncbi:acetyl-CoA carboxylase biotin carboxylase subunit [Umezawaea sp.]|uniref:acetyl-CoA carboxylase biotin carboxylase subunit n=1 Tax=Umezawaea sp. TaxID=1955258 RepID=UPI002ED2D1A8
MIETVLIANRGEIALRVARTCRELNLRTVAVHSTADRDSAVVRLADRAVQIGPPAARRSYLHVPAIMEAAAQTGADAIHPGYGFLSEDADFAEVCEAHGLTFIGPPASVLRTLGDKATARKLMADAGLPLLPGSTETLDSAAEARALADEIGYPVIIKAAAGGGGRGMAVVREPGAFLEHYQRTRAAAQAVFEDGRVYLERYQEAARHVEVQILCDQHGNAIWLGERDCSVQRRHQKLIEETPAPGLSPELTARMGEAAVRGALAAGFVGAGTFEFLVDPDGQFTFMEVNCRIQVEHPVTEMVTGIDLVREQLLVAAGRPLTTTQERVERRGVAIECRVNAEDPSRGFAPAPGVLEEFVPPGGPFTRVDTHGFTGARVTPDYDSLLAKVIAWAPDRDQAVARVERALAEFRVRGAGVRTTIPFLAEILGHPLFRDGKHTTSLVEQVLDIERK